LPQSTLRGLQPQFRDHIAFWEWLHWLVRQRFSHKNRTRRAGEDMACD
jgi:hypothetical protein